MRIFQEAGGDARKTIMGHLESKSSFMCLTATANKMLTIEIFCTVVGDFIIIVSGSSWTSDNSLSHPFGTFRPDFPYTVVGVHLFLFQS